VRRAFLRASIRPLSLLGLLEDEAVFVDRVDQALSETDPVIRLAGLLCA
jgi:hypothetical protein